MVICSLTPALGGRRVHTIFDATEAYSSAKSEGSEDIGVSETERNRADPWKVKSTLTAPDGTGPENICQTSYDEKEKRWVQTSASTWVPAGRAGGYAFIHLILYVGFLTSCRDMKS